MVLVKQYLINRKGHELIGFDIVDESDISIMAKKKF